MFLRLFPRGALGVFFFLLLLFLLLESSQTILVKRNVVFGQVFVQRPFTSIGGLLHRSRERGHLIERDEGRAPLDGRGRRGVSGSARRRRRRSKQSRIVRRDVIRTSLGVFSDRFTVHASIDVSKHLGSFLRVGAFIGACARAFQSFGGSRRVPRRPLSPIQRFIAHGEKYVQAIHRARTHESTSRVDVVLDADAFHRARRDAPLLAFPILRDQQQRPALRRRRVHHLVVLLHPHAQIKLDDPHIFRWISQRALPRADVSRGESQRLAVRLREGRDVI